MRYGGSRAFNAEGIVVRTRNLGDADRIVMLLTPDLGIVSCVAKSARKPKSRTGGKTDLLQHITFSARTGRNDLHQLGQVETLDAHLGLQTDLARLTVAAHMAELAERFSDTGVANPELFGLLRDGLALAEQVGTQELGLLRLWYDYNVLAACGFAPEVRRCVRTGKPIAERDHWWSAAEGGVVSDEAGGSVLTPASVSALRLLRHLARSGIDWGQASATAQRDTDVRAARALVAELVAAVAERGAGRAERVGRELG